MCGLYSTLCSHLIQFEEAGFPKHAQNFLYRIKNDNNINLFFQLQLQSVLQYIFTLSANDHWYVLFLQNLEQNWIT